MTDASTGLTRPYVPSDADLSRCVHCGLCLQHCPTYIETGLETESPRGRLYLIRALAEGRAEPTPNAVGHLDQCLQCRNCEAVCPSGVAYGRIMEGARASVLSSDAAPLSWRLRSLFLREVIAKPARLRVMAAALRAYRATGMRALAERTPLIRDRALLAPTIAGKPFERRGVLARPDRARKARVDLLTGCIMPLAYGRVHRATARVLARNGCEVVAPSEQACCGALHAHNGDIETARALARRNIDAFAHKGTRVGDDAGIDAIIVNSAGCGAAMKEYGELLAADPEFAARAHEFSQRVKDISEFLVNLPFEPPSSSSRLPSSSSLTVTYQDSCHLAHAQRITSAPRRILAAIPGLTLVEMPHPDRCCGSAGVYSLTQNEMSMRLLESKMSAIRATGATVVATSNPGCMTQLEAGARRFGPNGRVVHVIELLDKAYRA
jgi:glycolate oxidase iron-sulfur subunit